MILKFAATIPIAQTLTPMTPNAKQPTTDPALTGEAAALDLCRTRMSSGRANGQAAIPASTTSIATPASPIHPG